MIEMKAMKKPARARRGWVAGALALTGIVAGPAAHAEMALLKDSPLLNGSQSLVYSMLAPSAGSLSVKLDDLNFPAAIGDLSFALTTASGVLTTLQGEGELKFDISGPGAYYAIVSGTGAGKFGLGQLSLSVFFSPLGDPGPAPVPLPGALLLLLSGLGAFGLTKRRASI